MEWEESNNHNSKFLSLLNDSMYISKKSPSQEIVEPKYANTKKVSSKERRILGKFYSSITADLHTQFSFSEEHQKDIDSESLLKSMTNIIDEFFDIDGYCNINYKSMKYVELLNDINYVVLFYNYLNEKISKYIPNNIIKYIGSEEDYKSYNDIEFLKKFVQFYDNINIKIYQLEIYFKKINQNGLLANSTLLPIRKLANKVICEIFNSIFTMCEDRIATSFNNCIMSIIKNEKVDCEFYIKTWNLMIDIGLDKNLKERIYVKSKEYYCKDAQKINDYKDSLIGWIDYMKNELKNLRDALKILPLSDFENNIIRRDENDYKKLLESPFVNLVEVYKVKENIPIKHIPSTSSHSMYTLCKRMKLDNEPYHKDYDSMNFCKEVKLVPLKNEKTFDENVKDDSNLVYDILLQVDISLLEAARDEYTKVTVDVFGKNEENMSVLYKIENTNYLKELYKLLPNTYEYSSLFVQSFSNFIISSIKHIIGTYDNEIQLIDKLIELRKFCFEKVLDCFDRNSQYVDCISNSFRKAINQAREKVCIGSTIAKYLDKILRNWHLHKDDSEIFDEVVHILRHVEGKSSFENKYHNLLSKRIINNTSYDEGAERQMIKILREQIGDKIVSHMECMLLDIDISRNILQDFRAYISRSEYKDAYIYNNSDIKILTSIKWPVVMVTNFNYPDEFLQFQTIFEKFYDPKNKKKRLHYQPNLTDVVISANFDSCSKELIMSLVQAAILLLFNKHETLSIGEIQKLTGLGKEDTDRSLKSLTRENILIPVNKTRKYTVNTNFSHPQQRINVRQLHMKAAPVLQELSAADKKEAQKTLLEAAACRILKHCKTETVSNLHQLSMKETKLAVSFTEFKVIIEGLISKGFLERNDNNMDIIVYVP
uniref:CULLIN_2 domain-containing protein n=1 Tax=Parastrongyloides trichosuri TaxID=131310 RepID=A0A0N5A4Z1_PARTI